MDQRFEAAKSLEARLEILTEEGFKTELELAGVGVGVLMAAIVTATSEVNIALTDPFVPDLLEGQPGLFAFPNRIWRKDLINALRAGGS